MKNENFNDYAAPYKGKHEDSIAVCIGLLLAASHITMFMLGYYIHHLMHP